MALLVGYTEIGSGLVHAYVEDDSDETLCGQTILDPTHRTFPDADSGEKVCSDCMERAPGLQ
ncbi:MAG TPA: hypothetical protein VFX15_11420 [Actinomycetes bacterium]|nr:hypothetical protein [Actinomycetes bacterium]